MGSGVPVLHDENVLETCDNVNTLSTTELYT